MSFVCAKKGLEGFKIKPMSIKRELIRISRTSFLLQVLVIADEARREKWRKRRHC